MSNATKECPFCAETIRAKAVVCKHCGRDVPFGVPGSIPCPPAAVIEDWQALDLLSALVDKSLVVYEQDENGNGRYRLLETVRQYAQDRLAESNEHETLRARHGDHYLSFAEETEPGLHGPEQIALLARLEAEHDNLRAALVVALDASQFDKPPRRADSGLRLVAALFWFWQLHGYFGEGRSWLGQALEQTTPQPHANDEAAWGYARARARAQKGFGQLAYYQGDYQAAQSSFEESASEWRAMGDGAGLADVLVYLAPTYWERGDHARGRATLHESVALARAVGDPWVLAMALWMQGEYTLFHGDPEQEGMAGQGDPDAARPILEESAALFRQVGDGWGLGAPLLRLGQASLRQGDPSRARAALMECLGRMRAVGDRLREGYGRAMLAETALREGDASAAGAACRESLVLLRAVGSKWAIAYGLRVWVRLAAMQGKAQRAARLAGAEAQLRAGMGLTLPPHENHAYECDIAALRSDLPVDVFAAAFAEGRAMSLEQAVAYALSQDR